jgi:hypothetical protein
MLFLSLFTMDTVLISYWSVRDDGDDFLEGFFIELKISSDQPTKKIFFRCPVYYL